MIDKNPLVAILQRKLALDAGILPFDDCPRRFDFNKFLESMPPDEARIAKRKFRKLWRRISRRIFTQLNNDPDTLTGTPNVRISTMRKNMVANHFLSEALRMTNENLKKKESDK